MGLPRLLDNEAMTVEDARIEHIKTIGEYSQAWESKNSKVILTAWNRVLDSRAVLDKLLEERGEEE